MKPLPISNDGPPRQLGRFELVAELASGGMATVYLGRLGGAGGFQRFVAIKRLHSHLANDKEFVDMFLDEARLAARLHHPNVVPILEIGTSERGYYLVMEYVEGETLARLLNLSHQKGSPVPLNVTVRIFLDVLAGLHAAHELCSDDGRSLDIVHRDVSPQNVLVSVEGAAKITDFGVAHAADRLAHTRTGQLKGKFSYMAPEQALGYSVDRRADVFAVGTCLWEALATKRLFKGETEADTLEKVLRGPIPRLRTLNPNIHPAIEEVVARALDRERDRRPRSAAQFAEMLEAAALQTGVLGTQRDVSAHVQRVLGQLLNQQREAVRQWIAGMEAQRPASELDMQETRGPATRVDIPRPGARRTAPQEGLLASVPPQNANAVTREVSVASVSKQQPSLLAMADPSAASEEEGSVSVAIGAVERSAVSSAPQSRSSSTLRTLAIAAVLLAGGVYIGVSRMEGASSDSGETAESKTAPQGSAAQNSARGSKPPPPPVPTTSIGVPLVVPGQGTPPPLTAAGGIPGAMPGPMPGALPGAMPGTMPGAATAFNPNAPPPVPTTGLGSLSLSPTAPPPFTPPPPTVGVNELPAAPRAAAPRPAPRPAPRAEPRPRDDDPEPRPRRSEPRGESRSSGGDDDLGRNPYR